MSEVYDCCIFYQELDMLETRLHILEDVVDYFVICEAEETHSGQPKPLNLIANWQRFRPWQNRIIYVKAGPLSDGARTSWERERYHRSCISQGLTGVHAQDWIIVADVDEIPRPEAVQQLRSSGLQAAKLELNFYYYDLHHRVQQGWAIGAYRRWLDLDPNKIRTCAGYNPTPIFDAGWHFSYFGGPEAIAQKVDAFMHHADPVIRDLPRDPAYIAERTARSLDLYGRDLQINYVPLSNTLPHYILENKAAYRMMGWLE